MKQTENDKLFNDILERNYFCNFKKGQQALELYLNGLCKNNCEYCYLKKQQKDLFPIELYNKEEILKNLQLILDWYIKNNFSCPIDIFSGEWITTELRTPVFNILYNTFKNVQNYQKPAFIRIPDSMQFIKNKEITEEVQSFIEKMKNIHINISISASIDGKYCEDINDDNFYIDCFNFLNKNNFLCHPMISSNNIKNWINNYLWFAETAPKYITENLMTLEVRDETWETENIEDLLAYCNFLIDFKFQNYFNNDLEKFIKYIFQLDNNIRAPYSPELISIVSYFNSYDSIRCGLSRTLHIRVADLTLGLCHRLWYNNLILGKFNVENDEITTIVSQNVELLILKAHFKKSCMPHCENCSVEPLCPGFCCGNSYENYGNPIIPTLEVCKMYKAKYAFLIKKYEDMGVFKFIEDHPDLFYKKEIEKQYILNLKNEILKRL